MLWIGITGPIGGGKSTVAAELRQIGFQVLDADAVAHKVLSPGSAGEAAVFQTFGSVVKNADGALDRRALGRLVFADAEKLKQLEAIVHPLVKQEVAQLRDQLAKAGNKAAFYDVPLLFEKNMEKLFDAVLVVSAPRDTRWARLRSRMGLSEHEISQREARQLPAAEKEARASFLIRNDGDLESLRAAVQNFLGQFNLGLTSRN